MLVMIGPERDKGNEARKTTMFHSERFSLMLPLLMKDVK